MGNDVVTVADSDSQPVTVGRLSRAEFLALDEAEQRYMAYAAAMQVLDTISKFEAEAAKALSGDGLMGMAESFFSGKPGGGLFG